MFSRAEPHVAVGEALSGSAKLNVSFKYFASLLDGILNSNQHSDDVYRECMHAWHCTVLCGIVGNT